MIVRDEKVPQFQGQERKPSKEIACNVAKPHEKGKVEKGAIHSIRYNFWPLRSFRDLKDIQVQANHWRDHLANVRVHSTTGQKPIDRFKVEAMRSLPDLVSDCRDTATCASISGNEEGDRSQNHGSVQAI